MWLFKILPLCLIPYSTFCFASLPLGKIPPNVELSGDLGGKIDGSAWQSHELKGKLHLLVYSAPGAKDLNNAATEAIKSHQFPKDKFSSVAVINMKSSWLPNLVIEKAIESKQKDYPNTIYVKDNEKTLVKLWNLQDDSNNILLLGHQGTVLFSKDGKLNSEDIKILIDTIKSNLIKT